MDDFDMFLKKCEEKFIEHGVMGMPFAHSLEGVTFPTKWVEIDGKLVEVEDYDRLSKEDRAKIEQAFAEAIG